MDLEEKLSAVLEALDKLAVPVRLESLGGQGGGACRLKGKLLVFIDLDADPDTRYRTALSALSSSADVDDMYLLPEIREDLEQLG